MLKVKHLSDQQLIEFLSKGGRYENKAIQYLLDDNKRKITSHVLKNNGDEQEASSILVEGITHLVFNVRKGKFRGESKLGTYLFSICNGLWLKELRKNKRFTDFDAEENQHESLVEEITPLHYFNAEQLADEVNFLLEKLGNACKVVLKLWASHFSMTEISTQMGYKNSQIAMNKKNRCMTKLKEITKENAVYSESLKSYLG